ncbi:hypothetical protein WA171_003709 [Blastocystis sp. BT1]
MSEEESNHTQNTSEETTTMIINNRKCFKYNGKWLPTNDSDNENRKYIAYYDFYTNAPDYKQMIELGSQYHYNPDNPFDMFLLAYATYGKENRDNNEELKKIQNELISTQADAVASKKNADGLSKELIAMKEMFASAEAYYSNINNNPEILQALYQKNMEIEQLRGMLNQAKMVIDNDRMDAKRQQQQVIWDKDIELMQQKQKHMKESVHDKEVHMNELNEKDKQIVALQEHLNQTLGELQKAKSNATNGIQNLLDQSVQKELQMANTLTTFKQAAWSLLERVLTSYDNTLLFIENVCIAVQDCQRIVRALWDNNDNNINNRFSRISIPNVSQDKEAVQQFKNKYLQDIDQEVQMMKSKYQSE